VSASASFTNSPHCDKTSKPDAQARAALACASGSTGFIVLILPAIDLRGGQCVRLRQGDYSQETVFSADPAAMARRWVDEGAEFLHIVDLDGARDGRPVNGDSIKQIVQASGVPCQLGGGIRTEADIEQALAWGVTRVVIGTRALKAPEWLGDMCRRFLNKIVLGIDAKGGRVATEGWLQVSDLSALELATKFSRLSLAALVYTDISRDGMLQGPNLEAMREMAAAVPFPVLASGGVSSADDVARLAKTGVAGCIIGRALYEGKIKLADVLALGSDKQH
jgi:phosphoribosylformimino-5-aminoimidazole carboxamide ribotide isomerase